MRNYSSVNETDAELIKKKKKALIHAGLAEDEEGMTCI